MSSAASMLALLAQTPAMSPPPGVTPDFNGRPGSYDVAITATAVVVLLVTSILVPLRLWTKFMIMKSPKIEDFTCLVVWLLFVTYAGLGLAAEGYGAGAHEWDVSILNAMKAAEFANIGEILYMPAMFLTKFSILMQLLHIFVPDKRSGRAYLLYALIALNFFFFTALFFVQIFECTPRAKIWNPTLPGHCIDINKSFVVSAAINIASDVLILLFPTITIWRLEMKTKQKLSVSVIFATGVFAVICSIMRLVTSVQAVSNPDQLYALGPVALWAVGEMASGLLICSLPVMPRFVKEVEPKIANTYYSLVRSTRRSTTGSVSSGDQALSKTDERGGWLEMPSSLKEHKDSWSTERQQSGSGSL